MKWSIPALFTLALLGGCAIPARTTPPPGLARLPAVAKPAAASAPGLWPDSRWWESFSDPGLNRIIAAGIRNNPDLALAKARLDEARSRVLAARSALGTSLTAEADVTRQRLSANGIFPPPLGGMTFTQSELGVSAAREIDLWHRDHDLITASVSARAAESAQVAEAQLLLSKAIAVAYFQLGGAKAHVDADRSEEQEDRELLDYARLAYRSGASSERAVAQAQALLAQAHWQQDRDEVQLKLDQLDLAALVGRGAQFALTLKPPHLRAPPSLPLPASLPLDLVSHRPDVVARYWLVSAAAARVGAAKAGFYPNLELTGNIGLQSLTASQLLTGASLMDALGVAVHLPLFEPGRLRAGLGAARAEYDAAVDQYNGAVFRAAQDVSHAVMTRDAVSAQMADYQDVVHALQRELAIARRRYDAGAASIVPALRAQRDLTAARAQGADLQLARTLATVDLVTALGGGYREGRR